MKGLTTLAGPGSDDSPDEPDAQREAGAATFDRWGMMLGDADRHGRIAVLVARIDGIGRDAAGARSLESRGLQLVAPSMPATLIETEGQLADVRVRAESIRCSLLADIERGNVRVGVGGPIGAQNPLESSLREAERAIELPRRLDWAPGSVLYQEVMLFDLIEENSRLSSLLLSILRPLEMHESWGRRGEFLTTLEAYFDCGLARAATAEHLAVHPHTVDYRLRKIEEMLGVSVRETSSVMLLQGALAAMQLQRHR